MGIDIPKDLYVIGSCNTMISKLSKPPISTVSINLFSIGYHTVSAIQMITRNSESKIELNIKNQASYYPRESTENKPFSDENMHLEVFPYESVGTNSEKSSVTSFLDSSFMEVVKFEMLFKNIDSVDYKILSCIIENDCKKRSIIAERCFLSKTAMDYRF